ncbi:MAG TPA: L-aspartate oxidase [Oscillospiraceae bacterium]|nr:L-aspartate oxidase [Clostridia bacterium]HZK25536.1 L-aspartate oxidase [Oscillospiraceae bacterium]
MKGKYDVIIAGCGVAGLYAALQFDNNTNILLLSKQEKTVSGSSLAQGGVAAVLDHEDDSFDLHIEDTLIAGRYKNEYSAVEVLISEGPQDIKRILDMGVDFDRDKNGKLLKTLEGGHCRRRIVHHKDQTGKEMVDKLLAAVKQRPNIDLQENAMICSTAKLYNGFRLIILQNNEYLNVCSSYMIIATGGIGRVYQFTTNPSIATGDGIRFAYEMGAKIKNLSFVQFHPTAFNSPNSREQFLISEAVRGEGAYLLNNDLERFMHKYDERLELAPRDVVSRSIILESRRTGSNNFYLDIRHRGKEFVNKRFPAISDACRQRGVNMAEDLIPVFPCQHYLMGGIDVDLNSRTTVPRLYAAGECAHTGVHGGNRLASNSLLEALVFGRRAAHDIMRSLCSGYPPVEVADYGINPKGAPLPKGFRTQIREIMQRAYFVMPDEKAIHEGHRRLEEILTRLKSGRFALTTNFCEALSLATVATIILREVDE